MNVGRSGTVPTRNRLARRVSGAHVVVVLAGLLGGVLTLAALGYILNRLFLMIENRVLAWHYGYTQQQRN